MKNVFYLLFLSLISSVTIKAQVALPSISQWHIPVELAPNELQFFNSNYKEMGVSQVHIQHYGEIDFIYFNSEGFKTKSETYSNSHLFKRNLFTYTFFKDSIQVHISTVFFRDEDTTHISSVNFTFIDSLYDYPSGKRKHPYRHIRYNVQGKYIAIIDKTPPEIKATQKTDKFAHKYSGGGHRVSGQKLYSSKDVLVKEMVKEYDFFIASTPEYTNETEYVVKYRYYRNGLLKSCNSYTLSYQYFDKKRSPKLDDL